MWFIGVEVEQETSAPPPTKKSWVRPCDDDDHDDDHDDVDKEVDDSGIRRAGQTANCCCSKYLRVVTVHR